MSDIVERLRGLGNLLYWPEEGVWVAPGDVDSDLHMLPSEAAAEIERLRGRVAELEYWNGAVAVCREHVQDIVSATVGDCVICDIERLREALGEIADQGCENWPGSSGRPTCHCNPCIARRALLLTTKPREE